MKPVRMRTEARTYSPSTQASLPEAVRPRCTRLRLVVSLVIDDAVAGDDLRAQHARQFLGLVVVAVHAEGVEQGDVRVRHVRQLAQQHGQHTVVGRGAGDVAEDDDDRVLGRTSSRKAGVPIGWRRAAWMAPASSARPSTYWVSTTATFSPGRSTSRPSRP